MTKPINDALDNLKDLICSELSKNVTSIKIVMTSDELSFKVQTVSANQLRKRNISMRNIQGTWIKDEKT